MVHEGTAHPRGGHEGTGPSAAVGLQLPDTRHVYAIGSALLGTTVFCRTMMLRVALLLTLSPLSGCCTILATAISPITGPVDAVRLAVENHDSVWKALWEVPLMTLASPLVAFFVGLGVDWNFVANGGKYDRDAPERIGRPWYYMPGH